MSKKLKVQLHLLTLLLILILFFIPFSIYSTYIDEMNEKINNIEIMLNNKIDSLNNELNKEKDTLIIKPIKIELYEVSK
jgi:predicted PurR-regulated permease PerM